jgi:hypothetical protein
VIKQTFFSVIKVSLKNFIPAIFQKRRILQKHPVRPVKNQEGGANPIPHATPELFRNLSF